jgi:hypothetical protein
MVTRRRQVSRAVEPLRVILATHRVSPALKAECASALARLAPAVASGVLTLGVLLAAEDELQYRMMTLLAEIGDERAVGPLDRLAEEHPRAHMREEAGKAAAALRARLAEEAPARRS